MQVSSFDTVPIAAAILALPLYEQEPFNPPDASRETRLERLYGIYKDVLKKLRQ